MQFRIALNNSLKAIDKDIPKLFDSSLTKVILFGDFKYSDIQNHDILNSTINYILDSKHFHEFTFVLQGSSFYLFKKTRNFLLGMLSLLT